MSTVIGKDIKQHAPFDDTAYRSDLLMGTTALTLKVALPGPA